MASVSCEVAIIGAGPYGLSAAAHLRAAQVDVRVFGRPMDFWRNGMPRGMVLRSLPIYCHIADPHRLCTLDRFAEATELETPAYLGRDQFISYGEWFQRQLVPQVDCRLVTTIERTARGFLLLLADGDTCTAPRVVVASGLAHHKRRPPQFDGLPKALCTHSAEHNDFASFAGRRVVVIGAGQAGLESAVLLREAGAEPEVIVRSPCVHWQGLSNGAGDRLRRILGPIIRRYNPSPLIGTFPLNCILQRPGWLRRLPVDLRCLIAHYGTRPCAAAWLLSRAGGLHVSTGLSVVSATVRGSSVVMKLDDSSERCVDHVLLATGFDFNILNLPFLNDDVLSKIHSVRGYPVLSEAMESSLPRLHFVGVAAADACGPVLRFVHGTTYASRKLSRGVCGQRVPLPALAPQHCKASSPASL